MKVVALDDVYNVMFNFFFSFEATLVLNEVYLQLSSYKLVTTFEGVLSSVENKIQI